MANIFSRLGNFFEDQGSNLLLGTIGQINALDAEDRELNAKIAEENAKNGSKATEALRKQYFELIKTKAGREVITEDFIQKNMLNLVATDMLDTFNSILADIEAQKKHFGKGDITFSFKEGDSDNPNNRLFTTIENIDKKIGKVFSEKSANVFDIMDDKEYDRFLNYLSGTVTNFVSGETTQAVGQYGKPEGWGWVVDLGARFQNIAGNTKLKTDLMERYNLDFTNYALKEKSKKFAETVGVPENSVLQLRGKDLGDQVQRTYDLVLTDDSLKSLQSYAAYIGVDNVQDVVDNFWYHNASAWEDVDWENPENSKNAIKKYYHPFIVAMERLGNLELDNLDPNKANRKILSPSTKAKAYQEMVNGGLIIGETKEADLAAMRAALIPFMNTDLVANQSALGHGWRAIPKSERDYFMSRVGAFDNDKYFLEMAKGLDATTKSLETLRQLESAMDETQLAGTAEQFVQTLTGIFGAGFTDGTPGGFFSQLANKYNLEDGENGSAIRIAKAQINRHGLTSALGRAHALRIVAAFEMARAFDPSGRLSNMDVEMQLVRLGGAGFQDYTRAKEMITTAVGDLRKKEKYFSWFDLKQWNADGVMTLQKQAEIDATIALMDLEREHRKAEYSKGKIWSWTENRYIDRLEAPLNEGTNLGQNGSNNQSSQSPPETETDATLLFEIPGNPNIDTDNFKIFADTPFYPDPNNGISVNSNDNSQLIYNNPNTQYTGSIVTMPDGAVATKGIHWEIVFDDNNSPQIKFLPQQ